MHLVFDIFQAIGLAAALGIRPFLPGLAAGALAAGDVELSFKHTSYAFLQSSGFLLALVVGVILLTLIERRFHVQPDAKRTGQLARDPLSVILVLIGAGVGAVFFAGELCRGGAVIWPGYIAGPVCALIAAGASQPLFARVRTRLDVAAAKALPLYAEGIAILFAVLSVVAPPVGPIGLVLLVWLLVGGRRRGESKYAGLRILR